jgi:hypothetical protein
METQATEQVVPRPGVFPAYGHGWKYLWKHFGILLVIGIIYVVISYIFQIPQMIAQFSAGFDYSSFESVYVDAAAFSSIGLLFSIFVVYPISYGQYYAYLRAARDEDVEVKDMFEAFRNYWNAVGANLLVIIFVGVGPGIAMAFIYMGTVGGFSGVLAFVGFVLSVIFGILAIILACKLAFVPYIVVDRRMGAWTSIKESWRLSNGHAWKVFLIGLLGIPIFIAGLICLIIGSIISVMWITMAISSLYHSLTPPREAPVAYPSPIIE